jgi:vitamin K-dependent gamma-carboxylase
MVEDTLQGARRKRARTALAALASSTHARLSAATPIASLAAFRALFGLVMSGAAVRFLAKGWVRELLVAPGFHFRYEAFDFVKPLPGLAMSALYVFLALAALGVASGYRYRACAVAVFLGFTYVELIDKAIYLNHYYLVSLLAGFLMLVPAGRAYSLDSLRNPGQAVNEVPRWVLSALRLQVGVVYLFAGVAKLNADWLFEAQPLRIWLAARADWPVFGGLLATTPVAYFASWFGAAFDLSIPLFLLWPRTRTFAFAALVVFHVATGVLFPIGIFPWLMTAAATVFLAPDWPLPLFEKARERGLVSLRAAHHAWRAPRWLAPILLLHCSAQVLIPLRRFLESSNSAWTQRGFNFGWNVMVAEKAGQVAFRVRDRRSGTEIRVEPRTWLARFQEAAMAQDPEMVRQAALFLAERYRARGQDVAVFADAVASLNGRPSRLLIDPAVDLTQPLPPSWILPLD